MKLPHPTAAVEGRFSIADEGQWQYPVCAVSTCSNPVAYLVQPQNTPFPPYLLGGRV